MGRKEKKSTLEVHPQFSKNLITILMIAVQRALRFASA